MSAPGQTDLLEALQSALDGVEEAFRDAPADSGSLYQPPPDDDYEALVHQFEFLSGDWGVGLKVNFQITNHSKYSGRICGDLFGITPDRIGYLKNFLARLDVDVENMSVQELRPGSDLLNSLLDTPVLIRVKSKDSGNNDGKRYTNVYLQRKLGEPGSNGQGFTPRSDLGTQQGIDFGALAGTRVQNATDDDIPF